MQKEHLPSTETVVITFEDLHRLAQQMAPKFEDLVRTEIYISERGTFAERMKKPMNEEQYDSLEKKLRSIQSMFNEIRHRITNRFPEISSEEWNDSPIGRSLYQISTKLIRFQDIMAKRESFDTADLLMFFESMSALGELTSSSSLKRPDKEVLAALNDWATANMQAEQKNASLTTIARYIQMINLGAHSTEESLTNLVRSKEFLDLYPIMKDFSDSIEKNPE